LPAIAREMTGRIKTGIDEITVCNFTLAVLHLCIPHFYPDHVPDFSICIDRQFFWQDKRGKYDLPALYVLG
jgi:hypothetical protein